MKFSTIKYYIQEAFISLFRNGLMSVSSVMTVGACVFMILLSFVVASIVEYSVANLEAEIGMTAFIDEALEANKLEALRNDIMDLEEVEFVIFVSKEEALARFKEEMPDIADVLGHYENNNPLPRSFEIVLYNNETLDEVIRKLESEAFKEKGISEIQHVKAVTEPLILFNQGIRVVSLVLGVLFLTLSIVIITNTIKLTVNNRRVEIGIMKFIGATDAFIRWPFIIEGIVIGLFGAIIPIILSWVIYVPVMEKLIVDMPAGLLGLLSYRPAIELFPVFLPLGLIFGAGIGAIGSLASIRRYLAV